MSFSSVGFASIMAKTSTSCLTRFRYSSVFLFCDSPPAFHGRILGRCVCSGKGLYVGSLVCSEKSIFLLFLSGYIYIH